MRRRFKFPFAKRESAGAQPLATHTLEVVIAWGEHSILHVSHCSPPRAFYVGGEAGEDEPATDYALDRALLGCDRLPLALLDEGDVRVLVPAGAHAQLQLGDSFVALHELAAQGRLRPAPEQPGAQTFALPLGGVARVALGALCFTLSLARTEAAASLAPRPELDWKGQRWTVASLGLHLALLALFMLLPPPTGALALGEVDRDSRLIRFALTPPETVDVPLPVDPGPDSGGERGERAAGDEGAPGTPDAPVERNRGEARGHAPRSTLPRATEAPDPTTAGILGILRSAQLTAPMAFTGERAEGMATQDVYGALLGDQIGLNFGFGGIGMKGPGRGGGGNGKGTVGLSGVGTIGMCGDGTHCLGRGYGQGAGGTLTRASRVPRLRALPPDIRGNLSKETIRRVIHTHLAEVRGCYEQRLIARPDLQGRLGVKFVISPSGVVQAAAVDSSDLRDATTEQCIVTAVKRWTFPKPDGGGIVVVTYPFMLQLTGG